jgi:hypothetical protein
LPFSSCFPLLEHDTFASQSSRIKVANRPTQSIPLPCCHNTTLSEPSCVPVVLLELGAIMVLVVIVKS